MKEYRDASCQRHHHGPLLIDIYIRGVGNTRASTKCACISRYGLFAASDISMRVVTALTRGHPNVVFGDGPIKAEKPTSPFFDEAR